VTWLQIPIIFLIDGIITSVSYIECTYEALIMLGRQKWIQLSHEYLILFFEVEIAIENLKRYKLSGTDQIPAELIQVGGAGVA
jgi:hypothetical protein